MAVNQEIIRPNATEHAREKLDDITFREFVEYLLTLGLICCPGIFHCYEYFDNFGFAFGNRNSEEKYLFPEDFVMSLCYKSFKANTGP